MAYDYELDKIGYPELSLSLQNTIKSNLAHTKDTVIHVTQRDKDNWNTVLDLPLATNTKKGYISPEEKIKLAGIEPKANNYIHPNSGVKPGIYLQVEVNKEGHVIVGSNPSKINVTADNADRLGRVPADAYAKLVSPTFLGTPKAPTPEKTADNDQIVNIDYLNNYKPYTKQNVTPTDAKDKTRFWIGPNNCLNVYDNNSKWSSVFAEVALYGKALNFDITKPTKPNDYSNFMKFIGKRKISALGLNHIHSTSAEYATVWGMRVDEDEYAYEFLLIDKILYMRAGKGTSWEEELPISGGGSAAPSNVVTYDANGTIKAGNMEISFIDLGD